MMKENKRIHELDYIRGIAMFMVVMGHVLLFSLKVEHTALMALISICEMPLFFAVSGYLSHKEREENFKGMLVLLLKRSRALLVPLFVWSIVLNVCDGTVSYSLSMAFSGGYWFFLALWWCDVLNTFTVYATKKIRLGCLATCSFYVVVYSIVILGRIKNVELSGLLPIQNVQYYFPFFVIGLLMRKYNSVNKLVLNKYSYAIGMLMLIVGWKFSYIKSFVIWFVAALGSVIVIWMACREINSDLKVARILSAVGMNTLPIYAIHYVFIGTLPNTLHDMVYVHHGFFLQFVVSFICAVFVIAICLLVDRVLSLNSITRMLFFGESKKRKLIL